MPDSSEPNNLSMIKTIEWTNEGVRMIDQRKLPTIEEYPVFQTYQDVAEAIRDMVVRGAPAIGVAAAMGVARGVIDSKARDMEALRADFAEISTTLASTRPTAVNLFWAIERMKRAFDRVMANGADKASVEKAMVDEAHAI